MKTNRNMQEQDFSSSQKADEQLQNMLGEDREHLRESHDQERSRARAMAVLAASAMPAEAGIGGSTTSASWLSKLAGMKFFLGSLVSVVIVGGATFMVLDDVSEPTPDAKPSGVIQPFMPVDEPAVASEDKSAEEVLPAVEDQKEVAPSVSPTTPSGVNRHSSSSALQQKEEGQPAETEEIPEKQEESTPPVVRKNPSVSIELNLDPITSTKEEKK